MVDEIKNPFFISAVDRYRCIMQPERPHFSSSAAMFISFLMMVVSVLLTVPKFVTATVSFSILLNYNRILLLKKIVQNIHNKSILFQS